MQQIRFIFELFDGLYYHIGTELNCFFVIIVLACLMKYMKPRKTPYYIYVFTGVFCAALISVLNIFMAFMVQYTYADTLWIILVSQCLATFLYYTCMANIALYVVLLDPSYRAHVKGVEILGRSIILVATALTCLAYGLIGPERNVYGVVTLKYYIDAVITISFIAIGVIAGLLIFRRRHISKIALKGILMFLPFYIVFLVGQAMQERNICISFIALLPIFGMYMFFHSNPLDEILGCQNTYALEVKFNDNRKEKRDFYMGVLQIPSLIHKSISIEAADDIQGIIDLARMLEYTYENFLIYRKSAGEFYVIYEPKDGSDVEADFRQMASMMKNTILDINPVEKYVMLVLGYDRRIKNINMMFDIMQSAVEKYADQTGLCEKIVSNDELSELIEHWNLADLLQKLRDEERFDNDNVLCYAQPIYEIKSDTFRTAESLMRFKVKDEIVRPDVFIPIAESHNCIHFLTVCMLHKVCAAARKLMETSDFDAISVNVSVQEFATESVADEFLSIISSYEVPADKIRIELTESALEIDNKILAQNMAHLSEAGIKFYLDDFGTGYSSLERLTKLPFSVVKFDKSLLYGALSNDKTDRLVNGIVPILKGDRFVALVEGVENNEQYDYSVKIGFEYIQGYCLAKPVPIEELSNYFNKKE